MEPQSITMTLRHLQTDGDYSLRSRPAELRWSNNSHPPRAKRHRRAAWWQGLFQTKAVQL